jgi:prepilin-type processing-associated H-X9-DG protein
MNAKKGLTRADVIISAACLVLLVVNIQAISAGGRERSKREVCMANLRALTAAWQMFAGDNDGKIPSADIWYSWSCGFPGGPVPGWYEWPHLWPHGTQNCNIMQNAPSTPYPYKVEDWQHSIAEGLLWKYVKDYKLYRCPVSDANQYVTYTMAHSMNTWPNTGGSGAPTITNINQITQPAERVVFIDEGAAGQGAFFISYIADPIQWGDYPPMRHGIGTTFSFADGHVIYRKWTDPHTLAYTPTDFSWGMQPGDNCDCDLRWMVKATWGKVLFDCTDPAKDCAD